MSCPVTINTPRVVLGPIAKGLDASVGAAIGGLALEGKVEVGPGREVTVGAGIELTASAGVAVETGLRTWLGKEQAQTARMVINGRISLSFDCIPDSVI